MKNRIPGYVFWTLCIVDIFAITFSYPVLQWIAKPFLLPCLVYWYINETNGAMDSNCRLMVAGLLFCWLGDVLLMFESSQPLFFIFGLVSFLIGHIFYILYFRKITSEPNKMAKQNLLILLPVIVYVFVLLNILYPSLKELKNTCYCLCCCIRRHVKYGFVAGTKN